MEYDDWISQYRGTYMIHDPYNRSIQSIRYPITPYMHPLNTISPLCRSDTSSHLFCSTVSFMLQALPPPLTTSFQKLTLNTPPRHSLPPSLCNNDSPLPPPTAHSHSPSLHPPLYVPVTVRVLALLS